jgi:hypothetical protein
MSKMKELCISIEEALDKYRGPQDYKSCEEIADLLECPVSFVNDIVEQRWKETVGEYE